MADDESRLPLSGGQARIPTRVCRVCKEAKPFEEFEHREYGRRRDRCKTCANASRDPVKNRARVKAWQKANPEKRAIQAKRSHEGKRGDLRRWLASNLRTTRAYCKQRGIECSFTADDGQQLYELQNGKCALTGRDLLFGSKGQQRDSISIDRIEHGGPYALDNVRLLTYQANMARGMFSDDELYAFCEAVLATRAAALAEAAE